jgi:hypothetical protein
MICYNVLHCSQKAAPTLVLEYYGMKKELLSHFEGDVNWEFSFFLASNL